MNIGIIWRKIVGRNLEQAINETAPDVPSYLGTGVTPRDLPTWACKACLHRELYSSIASANLFFLIVPIRVLYLCQENSSYSLSPPEYLGKNRNIRSRNVQHRKLMEARKTSTYYLALLKKKYDKRSKNFLSMIFFLFSFFFHFFLTFFHLSISYFFLI